MKKETKTNVMRVLDSKGISYRSHTYEPDSTMSAGKVGFQIELSPEDLISVAKCEVVDVVLD